MCLIGEGYFWKWAVVFLTVYIFEAHSKRAGVVNIPLLGKKKPYEAAERNMCGWPNFARTLKVSGNPNSFMVVFAELATVPSQSVTRYKA